MAFLPILTVMFIGLKLTGDIWWSWFWVLFPLLIHYGVILFLAIIMLLARAKSETERRF